MGDKKYTNAFAVEGNYFILCNNGCVQNAAEYRSTGWNCWYFMAHYGTILAKFVFVTHLSDS